MMGSRETLEEASLSLQPGSLLRAFGTFVKPCLGLTASSSSLGDTVAGESLWLWGVPKFTPSASWLHPHPPTH